MVGPAHALHAMAVNTWTADRVPDQAGATIFITGATSGIGFEAAKLLAGKGARVLLGCRSHAKGEGSEELTGVRYDL